jgi:hypothetical protein
MPCLALREDNLRITSAPKAAGKSADSSAWFFASVLSPWQVSSRPDNIFSFRRSSIPVRAVACARVLSGRYSQALLLDFGPVKTLGMKRDWFSAEFDAAWRLAFGVELFVLTSKARSSCVNLASAPLRWGAFLEPAHVAG